MKPEVILAFLTEPGRLFDEDVPNFRPTRKSSWTGAYAYTRKTPPEVCRPCHWTARTTAREPAPAI